MDGLDACELIRKEQPEIKVLIISAFPDSESIRKILDCGAHGFFTKNAHISEIADALRDVKEQDFLFSSDLNPMVKEAFARNAGRQFEPSKPFFSKREIEIIDMICADNNTRTIAKKLFISPRTVETHRMNISKKIGSKSLAGMVRYALENGLLDEDDLQ